MEIEPVFYLVNVVLYFCLVLQIVMVSWCLTPLSTIFQLSGVLQIVNICYNCNMFSQMQ